MRRHRPGRGLRAQLPLGKGRKSDESAPVADMRMVLIRAQRVLSCCCMAAPGVMLMRDRINSTNEGPQVRGEAAHVARNLLGQLVLTAGITLAI